jgi:pilus assembly protein CpaB
MRPKSLALLLLALGCGLVASLGIMEVIARNNKPAPGPSGATQPIFVAMTDIGLGDLVTANLLKLEQWPKDKVPQGALARIEDIEGRRARTKLFAGEPILDGKLLGKGASEQGATALIPKGYRVVTVKVDLVSGGSSLILPGDRVDVMVHLVKDTNREISETVTRTILQDIKVFAVNDVLGLENKADGGKSIAAKTISLLVTPEQAAKVMLASQMGSIQLVMRSPEDDLQAPQAQARPAELFAGTAAKSERDKENLVEPVKSKPSLMEILAAMQAKQASQTPKEETKSQPPRHTWIMRILKPGEIEEVQFEEAVETGGAEGNWKITTQNPVVAPQKPAPPASEPPAQSPPPTPPAAEPPAEPPPQPELNSQSG